VRRVLSEGDDIFVSLSALMPWGDGECAKN